MNVLPALLQVELSRRAVRSFAPGDFLARPTDTGGHVWYLHAGLTRFFSLAQDGREHVHGFPGAGEWVHGPLDAPEWPGCCALPALGVEAVMPTRATAFELRELDQWRRDDLGVASYLTQRLMAMAGDRLGREAALVTRSAEQRYRELVLQHPDMLDHVRLQDIAQWLGITPIALSRIRRRIRNGGDHPGGIAEASGPKVSQPSP